MNAAEAGAIPLEEPDWRFVFESRVMDQTDNTPIELKRDKAFDQVLSEYRRYHFTWLEDGKRRPMSSADAVIALAKHRIFAPRSRRLDLPLDPRMYEPDRGDNHCWLQLSQRAWRIRTIDGGILFLDSFGEEIQIGPYKRDLWDKYVDKAYEALVRAYPMGRETVG